MQVKSLTKLFGLAVFVVLSGQAKAFCGSNDPLKAVAPPASLMSPEASAGYGSSIAASPLAPLRGAQIALDCGLQDSPIFSGAFRNLQNGKLETVVVTKRKVCADTYCQSIYYGMRDAAERLIAIGQRPAVESAGFAQTIAEEITKEFEDPCLMPGEPISVYVERAQAQCRLYVVERMPWYTWGFRGFAAFSACLSRQAGQQAKARDPGMSDMCGGE